MSALAASAVRMRTLLVKEFLHLLRDPRMRFFMILPPLVQLIIFGYAAAFDVRHATVGVVDRDGGPPVPSRNLNQPT